MRNQSDVEVADLAEIFLSCVTNGIGFPISGSTVYVSASHFVLIISVLYSYGYRSWPLKKDDLV